MRGTKLFLYVGSLKFFLKERKKFIDRKFPSGNIIIIQINTLLTYKE